MTATPTHAIRAAQVVVVFAVLCSCALAEAKTEATYTLFANSCGFDWTEIQKKIVPSFTDRDYSGQWRAMSIPGFENCADCYRSGSLLRLPSGRAVGRLWLRSESGDWSQEITYCFSPGGSLNMVLSVFDCAWGWSDVRTFKYSNGGLALLQETFEDLKTRERIATPATLAEWKNHLEDVKVYKTVSALPFFTLASSPTGKNAKTH